MFAANPEKLALAIQWTVICRTGDRRKWRLSGCNDEDEFLRILGEVVQQSQDGTESPQTLRLMALRLFKRRYPTRGGDNPLWCQFLQRIEEQAPENTNLAEQERDSQEFGDFELYRVNTNDLANLLDAIREVRVCGFPMFHDPTTVAMTVLFTRDPADLPLRPQVMEATRAVLLSHRRKAKRAQKLSMLDIRRSLAPSQSGGAQDDVDEERDLGHPLDTGLNLPDVHLDEAVAEADIARENAEEQAKEVGSQDEQAGVPEMDQNNQEAARGTRTGGVSSSGGEIGNAGKNEQPEDDRPTHPSPARAMPRFPRLDQPDTAGNADHHQNNGQAAQQGHITARERQRMEVEHIRDSRRGSAMYTAERFASNPRDDPVHLGGGGRSSSGENLGQDGQEARAAPPNDPNVEQPATRVGQQILGKRPRESESVEPAGEFRMPYFRPDEVTIDRDANGKIIGMRPNDPLADGSNMLVPIPGGPMLFQCKPLTGRGLDIIIRAAQNTALGSSTGEVTVTVAGVEDIGLSNNLERLGVSSIGQPSEALPAHLLLNQNQTQTQNRPRSPNRNQGRNRARNRNRD